ncbi:MAG TPA: type I DNA topoisomerase, partial [Bacilli bacterium]|nr:type I DNA topoisomerase [Bacilli bacterium]
MEKYLVIVESPAKSKTIEKYLGKQYQVLSSKGHIRDLKKSGYGGYGVDLENNFEPQYSRLRVRFPEIKALKEALKDKSKVYLATDPDREGESIAWHLAEVLELNEDDYERVEFNEITKKAVLEAFEHPRKIDQDLVHAQETRRILDRIIGFSLSKLLQKKIGSKSAGRVQSVVLKIIVDHEKEIEAFIPEEYWEIFANFRYKKTDLKAKLMTYNNEKIELKSEEDTNNVINNLTGKYLVDDIIEKERRRNPRPPFTTSTFQQEASSKFNFTAKKTMMIAQGLYEGVDLEDERVGLITYMRTDSQRLSNDFMAKAKDYIINNYGKEYYAPYLYKTNDASQDAHEAIRPTNLDYHPEKIKKYLTLDQYKIYTIIYNRALAALMAPALFLDTKVKIDNNGYGFELNGSQLLFKGFLEVYDSDSEDNILPKFTKGEEIKNVTIEPVQNFTKPPARYTEAKLIKKMEELGIGRPSTYSSIIDTLKMRYYVRLENKSFIPTDQGKLTTEKLDEYFSEIINITYTADMEKHLDDIAEGKLVWYKELAKFYDS